MTFIIFDSIALINASINSHNVRLPNHYTYNLTARKNLS